MVKRLVCISCIILVIFLYICIPALAVDVVQTDADMFGFSYDNSKIWLFDHTLSGYKIDVDNQVFNAQKIYFYIPCTQPVNVLDFSFSLCVTGGSFIESSCDYGYIYSNSYHIEASLPVSNYQWVGTSTINGSTAKVVNCKRTFSDLPFTGYSRSRYIRYCVEVDSNYSSSIDLLSYLNKNLNQGLSGTLGNASYTISATQGDHVGTVTSGSLTESGYYITGSLKNKYYNGSSVATNTGNLVSGTSGSGGYLYVPSHTISVTASSPLKMNISGGNIAGNITPSQASQLAELQGTYLDRTYVDTVSVYATRSYDDSDLIQAVNDASDRNHTDITNFSDRNHSDLVDIGNDLQELVDHQNQVTQAGNDIGSTTSSSSISNTSGNLGSGVSGLNSTLSTASDVSSFVTASTPYINFIGASLPVLLNFGNGVFAWAVVALIAVTVFLYILKKVSE